MQDVTPKTSLRILNWNVGGAKYFHIDNSEIRKEFRDELNANIRDLVHNHDPDVIVLQEIVAYGESEARSESIIENLAGYRYYQHILIDTVRHPHVSKWRKAEELGKWPPGTYFGQGLGLLWRADQSDFRHCPIWSVPNFGATLDDLPHVEDVPLRSGLYFGTRDTEPRAALIAHFLVVGEGNGPKPLDVFVINLHLTTLTGEREGSPRIDEEAARIRLRQVNIILENIISTYNEWAKSGYLDRLKPRLEEENETFDRGSPIWIMGGDFNFTPETAEFHRIQRANFTDACPHKSFGTKGSGFGTRATITCDYIFAGPRYISLDPLIMDDAVIGNPQPLYHIRTSDHYPLFATIPLKNP